MTWEDTVKTILQGFFVTYINCSFVIYGLEVDSGYGLILLFSFFQNLPLKHAFFCDMKTLAHQHLVHVSLSQGQFWGRDPSKQEVP